MRALQGIKVSSTMTKSNPRPRKYASASDRQAAYRARAPEMCLRAESKTVDTLDRIAADLDISRADLLLSMTKFALANHDWARFGLTHKPLPFEYGIEKEKISINPLPIWARPRPKNLGKSIPLTAAQKRKAKSLAAAAGRKYPNLVDNIAASRNPSMRPGLKSYEGSYVIVDKKTGEAVTELFKDSKLLDKINTEKYEIVPISKWLAKLSVKENPMKKPSPAQIAARERFAEMARSGELNRKRQIKSNPGKKNVSEKISQLVHEGYPQKQAVAIALSEQRAGKVKKNPMITSAQADLSLNKPSMYYLRKLLFDYSNTGHVVSVKKTKGQIGISLDGGGEMTVASAKKKLEDFFGITSKTSQKTNPASGRKGSRTLLNPMAAPVKSNSYSNFKYCVEAKRSLGAAGSVFETVAMFATKAQAQDYAKSILKSHPSVTLRIKTYK